MRTFCLGVWNSPTAISDDEAAGRYLVLSDGKSVPSAFNGRVYAFYRHLTDVYPEIEMVPESELDECPWACALDVDGGHVIVPILPERSEEVVPVVLGLAEQYGLICFDPQAGKVHLPLGLRPWQAGVPHLQTCISS